MKFLNTVKKLNRQSAVFLLILAMITLFFFACNQRSNLIADDYQYCFSFADGERITEIGQIFRSISAHRDIMNGRIFPHFLVQLFLLLPLTVFRALNSVVTGVLLALICRISSHSRKYNVLLLVTVFACLWLLQRQFGQVFLWLDGAVNYLWCGVLSLLFLLPYVRKFMKGRDMSASELLLFFPFAVLVGGWSENGTVGLVFMVILFLLSLSLLQRKRLRPWMFIYPGALLLGFAIMMSAPAELRNKSAEFSVNVLWGNFLNTALIYLNLWPILLSLAAMLLLSVKLGTDRDRRILSLIFLGGSLASHFVLTFAMYCAERSTFVPFVLLLCAWGIMFEELWCTKAASVMRIVCGVLIVCGMYRVCIGFKDISETHYTLTMNEEIITAAASEGEKTVQLPRVYPKTGYSPVEGLNYLNEDDPNDWSNEYMAKFYGVDSVIGY